jgi:hypothetical protein
VWDSRSTKALALVAVWKPGFTHKVSSTFFLSNSGSGAQNDEESRFRV